MYPGGHAHQGALSPAHLPPLRQYRSLQTTCKNSRISQVSYHYTGSIIFSHYLGLKLQCSFGVVLGSSKRNTLIIAIGNDSILLSISASF